MRNELSRYRLVRLLGKGGMGEVHVAEDTSRHNRQVAVKLLPTTALSDPESEKRFRRECELAAQIDHPNVLHPWRRSAPSPGRPTGARPCRVCRCRPTCPRP